MTQWNPDLIRRFGGPGPRYTSYPPATQFHEEVGEEDYRRAVARGNQARRPLSLYCHIPFCATVCYYCACNRIITGNRAKAEDYLTFLKQEIKAKAALVDPQRPVVQMHWGGGTPTYLSDAQMTELVYDLARHFNLLEEDRGEYAIEVDPRTVDRARLGLLRGLGFNRLSIGIQDLDPVVQKAVNREQSLELITEVFDAARDFGFHSINADMIYGLPWQSSSSGSLPGTIAGFTPGAHFPLQLRPHAGALQGAAADPGNRAAQPGGKTRHAETGGRNPGGGRLCADRHGPFCPAG